jgi:sugar phosphate isomerase/epimerase
MAELILVGYTYRGYEMAYAFERARAFGYSGVELRDFADIDLTHPDGVARALKEGLPRARASGLGVRSLFYAPLPVSRMSERASEEKEFSRVMALLARFGVPVLHTRLSLYASGEVKEVESAQAQQGDYAAVQETLQRIAPLAEQHGVRIALEAHMGTIHDSAASLLRIVTACASPSVTAGLDFANFLITQPNEDLVKAIRAFGPHTGYTHIKNVKLFPWGYDWNLPVRLGDINYFRVLQTLKETGYRGPLAVEYCGTGDPDVFAEDDARYMTDLARRVGI